MALVSVTLVIEDISGPIVGLGDTRFTVQNDAETAVLFTGITDQGGISAPFALEESTDYKLLLSRPLTVFTVPEVLAVGAGPGPLLFMFNGVQQTVAPPSNPEACIVFGTLINLDTTVRPYATILVDYLGRVADVGGNVVTTSRVSVQTDENGEVQIQLLRNARVRLSIENTRLSARFDVPDQPIANLAELLEDADNEIGPVIR